jgi:hypothetical protein
MKNFGQPWALVLAPGDNDSDVDAPSAFAALLRGVLNRAAAFADRAHIWAVVTQQRRQRELSKKSIDFRQAAARW